MIGKESLLRHNAKSLLELRDNKQDCLSDYDWGVLTAAAALLENCADAEN